MFFCNGSDSRKFVALNGLQGKKNQKTEKAREKMVFCSRAPPVFLPNRPVFGSFLTVKLLLNVEVDACQPLARF
jgi:hypothetical protein